MRISDWSSDVCSSDLIDAKLLIETAHPLQRAVQPYRLPITGAAQFSDQPLRLSKRIGAHQDPAIRIGLARSDQLAAPLLARGMTEYGESKSCFRDEDDHGCRDEGTAGRRGRVDENGVSVGVVIGGGRN